MCSREDLTQQPFWNAFVDSSKRRNKVAHAGETVGPNEAAESVESCRALVRWIKVASNFPSRESIYAGRGE